MGTFCQGRRVGKREGAGLTLGLARGFSCSSFLAAASMAAAAPRSSFSAMTVGSSGSTHSVPGGTKGLRKGLSQSREVRSPRQHG